MSGVQRRTARRQALLAIEKVPQQRVAQVGQVDPDLVSAAGLQLQFQQGKSLPRLQGFIAGHGGLSVRTDHLLNE